MGIQNLFTNEGHWSTEMGKAFPTERVVFRGKDLHKDLKDLSWFELNLYGITGRRFNENELKVLNFIWVSTSYPEPRVWNNRIASICGSARVNGPNAIAAAIGASEATVYGGRPVAKGFDFLHRALEATRHGQALEDFIDEELANKKVIFSFGRAMVKTDERVPHMLAFIKEYGMDQGECVQMALEAERILNKKKGLSMNIGALVCSLAIDMGFSFDEFHMFMTLVFAAGMMPCYMEAAQKPEGAFFPMRCEHVHYIGKKPRRSVNDSQAKNNVVAAKTKTKEVV